MTTDTMEWAPFRLKPEATEAELAAASETLQRDFLAAQPGFLRRDLLRGPDGAYVDAVWWATPEAAAAAMALAADSPVCSRYFALMSENGEDAGAGVSLFRCLGSY